MSQAPAEIRKHARGGEGRRKARSQPKGRQVDRDALDQVQALLGDRLRRSDLLIEHLHLIQDEYGHLSAAHLAALAFEMKMAQAEVYEVASFYAHFDIVREGEIAPPPVTVRVCDSLSCEMFGAAKLLGDLGATLDPAKVRVIRAPAWAPATRRRSARSGMARSSRRRRPRSRRRSRRMTTTR